MIVITKLYNINNNEIVKVNYKYVSYNLMCDEMTTSESACRDECPYYTSSKSLKCYQTRNLFTQDGCTTASWYWLVDDQSDVHCVDGPKTSLQCTIYD